MGFVCRCLVCLFLYGLGKGQVIYKEQTNKQQRMQAKMTLRNASDLAFSILIFCELFCPDVIEIKAIVCKSAANSLRSCGMAR